LGVLVFPAVLQGAPARTPTPTDAKLGLRAALVLTPEFCATKSKKGDWFSGKESFEIGKAACKVLEPALSGTFSHLSRVEAAPPAAEADLVLSPRFVDVGATKALGAFSNRELVVLLEWTAKDAAGKTIWIETVQGSSKHHMGNLFTHGKNVRLIVNDAVKDVAAQSATKMAAAPEFRKLAGAGAPLRSTRSVRARDSCRPVGGDLRIRGPALRYVATCFTVRRISVMTALKGLSLLSVWVLAGVGSHVWAANLLFGHVQTGTIGSAAQSNSYSFSASPRES
jgi:hypothetical protein